MTTEPKKLKLLVVEDNPTYTLLVKETLSNFEAFDTVLVKEFAANGKEALDKFRKFSPDITFLDINLPDSSGLDLLKAFLEIQPNAYITMLTSEAQAVTVKTACERGAQGYILKPFNAGQLKDVLTQYQKHGGKVPARKPIKTLPAESPTEKELRQEIHAATANKQPVKVEEVFKSWRVFVADGNLGRQTRLHEFFAAMGCTLKVASSGQQAWNILRNEHFDLVLIDINLPEIDGYQIANQLRLNEQKKPVKTHVIGLYAQKIQVNEARMGYAGVSEYLLDPLKLEDLKKKLTTYAYEYVKTQEDLFIS